MLFDQSSSVADILLQVVLLINRGRRLHDGKHLGLIIDREVTETGQGFLRIRLRSTLVCLALLGLVNRGLFRLRV